MVVEALLRLNHMDHYVGLLCPTAPRLGFQLPVCALDCQLASRVFTRGRRRNYDVDVEFTWEDLEDPDVYAVISVPLDMTLCNWFGDNPTTGDIHRLRALQERLRPDAVPLLAEPTPSLDPDEALQMPEDMTNVREEEALYF